MKTTIIGMAALAGLLAMPATADGNRSVIATRYVAASPEAVVDAFVRDADLRDWWQVTRSLVEPGAGGVWSVTWDDWGPDDTHHSWSGIVRELEPNRLLVTNMVMIEPDMPLFGPMQLEIRAEAAGDGSTVTVTHSGYGYGEHWDRMYELVVQGWDHVLGDLAAWFEGPYAINRTHLNRQARRPAVAEFAANRR